MVAIPVPTTAAAPVAAELPAPFKGRLKRLHPLYRSFELWSDADGLRMSAAMSFYGILSLAPLLVLIVALLGWWLDREMLETSLINQIGALVGTQGAEVIKAAIDSAREPGQGLLASVVAFVLLFVGATGVFAELQSALERLWTQGTGAAAVDAWWHTATLRLRGIAYVLAFGFLMLVSTVISSLLGLLETWAGSQLDMKLLLALLNQAISFLITTALFVSLMRMSAGPQPRLRYLIRGAAVAALLFGVGKYGLALYLSTAAVVSAYGAAGSLVVLLMWIYFAAAVLLYGASLARVMAERVGDFAPGPTPPPAAAVTGLKGAAREQGDELTAQAGTAAVAAALAEAASPDAVAAGGSASLGGARHGLRTRMADLSAQPDKLADGLAVLISLAGAYWLSRAKAKPTGLAAGSAAATAPDPTDARRARGLQSEPRASHRHPAKAPPAWLGAAVALARGVAQGVRLAQGAVRHRPRDTGGTGLQSPSALRAWGGRAAQSQVSHFGAHWHQWRERQALRHAQHMLARDVRELRDAAKGRLRRD
ncbi:MAG: YihY/virulence factor BrkB family protein [Burkholderiales bacterium]|nr:YihY/virulence factor BrkB family protein [Burkholderiales bacterium]